ncbi:unnamed protein product (macronuclear) [Paramecium tetraurelia]|uniref:Protein kinase domain-containing protein n=1 Tax=Paramecium tetraurelia TaxID=5888 RepID=A0BQ75_PARTE|nr:uncharacterized protein GSPATT00005443001 [Paramecium tetraurelia]CAK60692.1 unnamed protein product [Paramecium tetraurelia]|eukprot:XP_001428090.1 hypothetical protein (macronuclear) [Paramecium tetraurelia strain d4-2]
MQQNYANFIIKDAQIERFFNTLKKEPLGSGRNSIVYLTQHRVSSVYFALKEPRKDQLSQQSIINEINIFIRFWQNNNQEFPRCVPYMEKFSETNQILMEYMKNGSLLDILLTSGKFAEKFARLIAINLYNQIGLMHRNGVVHFDLKPDNIMFNENMMLKICDFGFANQPIGFTQGYASPEQIQNKIIDAEKCDVFAYGVILFIIVMGFPPFQNYQDNWYKMISNQQWDQFWSKIKQNGKTDPSDQFKDLITKVIEVDVNKRYNMQNISTAEWFSLEKVSDQECTMELIKRINLRNLGYYKY